MIDPKTLDHEVAEYTDNLLQDIDLTRVSEHLIPTLREFGRVLYQFDWPQRQAGGEIFSIDQLSTGEPVLCYHAWEPDNDVPDDDTVRAFVFITSITHGPVPEQLLDAVVSSFAHEAREQLRFNGEHLLFPDDEHGRREMIDGTVYNDRGVADQVSERV